MKNAIPWKAPAVLGWRQPGTLTFVPEIAGLTLNEALQRAVDPDRSLNMKACILVDWGGEEVLLHGRRIFQLAVHPSRPPLRPRE